MKDIYSFDFYFDADNRSETSFITLGSIEYFAKEEEIEYSVRNLFPKRNKINWFAMGCEKIRHFSLEDLSQMFK